MTKITHAQTIALALGGNGQTILALRLARLARLNAAPISAGCRSGLRAGLAGLLPQSGCDFRDILRAVGLPRYVLRLYPKTAAEADARREAYAAEQRAKARRHWASCKLLAGTKGEAYLRGRGVTCPLPPSLGWAADAFHGPNARWLPAMVGHVSTGGVHRPILKRPGPGSATMPR